LKIKHLPLTEENIEEQHKVVGASSNYGKEDLITTGCILRQSRITTEEADFPREVAK